MPPFCSSSTSFIRRPVCLPLSRGTLGGYDSQTVTTPNRTFEDSDASYQSDPGLIRLWSRSRTPTLLCSNTDEIHSIWTWWDLEGSGCRFCESWKEEAYHKEWELRIYSTSRRLLMCWGHSYARSDIRNWKTTRKAIRHFIFQSKGEIFENVKRNIGSKVGRRVYIVRVTKYSTVNQAST